jgi:hypothetical protein
MVEAYPCGSLTLATMHRDLLSYIVRNLLDSGDRQALRRTSKELLHAVDSTTTVLTIKHYKADSLVHQEQLASLA